MNETDTLPAIVRTERFSLERGLRSREFRAREIGVSDTTIYRAYKSGALGFCRVGDRILHSDIHVEEWLARLEQPGRSRRNQKAAAR